MSSRLLSVQAGEELPGGWVVREAGDVITGKLGSEKIQIFEHPDRVIEDFANTSKPEDILRFTRRYGVLRRKDVEWFEIAPNEEIAGDSFLVRCAQWTRRQQRLQAEWGRKGKADNQIAQAVADEITVKSSVRGPLQTFVRPRNRGFQIELQPDDLLGALWLAFLGFSDRTRKCLNPTCATPYFIATRRDQKFCNEKCARLVANREWWLKKGAQWRKSKTLDSK
jgi:hypothetical protein